MFNLPRQYSKTIGPVSGILLMFLLFPQNAIAEDTPSIPVAIKQQLLQGQFSLAAKQLEVLVAKNNTAAKYQLAILLLNGRGVKQSVKRAQALLLDSANQLPDAAFLLGSLYFKGKQVDKNDIQAKRYLSIASEAGNLRAERLLSKIVSSEANANRIKPQTQRLFELAISSGNLSLAVKQYNNGANLNYHNEKGDPPIITAIRLQRSEIAYWLINQKVDLNKRDRDGNVALHIAAKLGQVKTAVFLAKQLDNIEAINKDKQTPLIVAIKFRRQVMAQWFINQGANRTTKDRFSKNSYDYNKKSKLSLIDKQRKKSSKSRVGLMAKKQITHQIQAMKTQAKTQTSPYYNWPLLAIAVAQGQIPVAKELLDNGNSPWLETREYDTAISLSLENEHYDFLNLMLIKHPIEQQESKEGIENLFYSAIKKGQTKLVNRILNHSRKIGLQNFAVHGLEGAIQAQNVQSTELLLGMLNKQPSSELLRLSITEKDFKVTQLLIDSDIALNDKDNEGRTPLIIAAQKTNAEVLTLLLEKNVPLEIADSRGLTALMWASKQNCLACVRILILNGADPEKASLIGNTAVMFAAQKSNLILTILLASEPDLTARNQRSLTALMLAVGSLNKETITTLLSHGANPKRKNSSGQDSFDMAGNNPEILALLNDY